HRDGARRQPGRRRCLRPARSAAARRAMSELLLGAQPGSRGRVRDLGLAVGALLVGLVVVAALVSWVWTPYDATLVDPNHALAGSSWSHPLGTDNLGVDELSQLMVGARTTLLVGIVAIGVAALGGIPLGIIAAERGGLAEDLVMRFADVV